MKKLSMWILALTIVFAGCTNQQEKVYDDMKVVSVKSIDKKAAQDEVGYAEHNVNTEEAVLGFTFKEKFIEVSVENISDTFISIDWKDAKYVGYDGMENGLFDTTQEDKGYFTKELSLFVKPGMKKVSRVLPDENIDFIGGSGNDTGDLIIRKDLFEGELENKKQDYIKLMIPIVSSNKFKNVYEVIFAEGEVQLEKVEADYEPAVMEKEAVEAVVEEKTEVSEPLADTDAIHELKKENEELKSELKTKEELLEMLKKQNELIMDYLDSDKGAE